MQTPGPNHPADGHGATSSIQVGGAFAVEQAKRILVACLRHNSGFFRRVTSVTLDLSPSPPGQVLGKRARSDHTSPEPGKTTTRGQTPQNVDGIVDEEVSENGGQEHRGTRLWYTGIVTNLAETLKKYYKCKAEEPYVRGLEDGSVPVRQLLTTETITFLTLRRRLKLHA